MTCRSVFLAEVLAKGEVPRDARSIWKQRSRWASAAHMYILDPSSVFWRKQKNMSYWQKSLYWIPMVLHWTLLWAEPIMFSMPIVCLAGTPHAMPIGALLFSTRPAFNQQYGKYKLL
jgi:cellulose synthase/poly-beta-1,6-N-acetylglucosamine synthase-like glycosyltransferase